MTTVIRSLKDHGEDEISIPAIITQRTRIYLGDVLVREKGIVYKGDLFL